MVFGLFKKKGKKTEKKDDRFISLKIKEVVNVAKESVNVVFEKPLEPFDYQPGQFLTIIQEVNGKKLRRAYSLCTSPFADANPAVTVKRVPGGQMSNYINDHFAAGQSIEVMKPMGMFTTQYDSNNHRKAVFLGGGSGITPLYAIMRSVLIEEPNSEVALVYGNRTKDYAIFKDELESLKNEYKGRFQLIHILEDDDDGFAQYIGRPTTGLIGEIIGEIGFGDDSEYYICGPEPMMQIAKSGLLQIGVPESRIRMESFEAGKTSPSDVNSEEAGAFEGNSEVTIILDGEEYKVSVNGKTAILEAGLEAAIDMPYSCQSGLCTACRAKCLEGKIDQEDAEGLSDEEKQNGYVLLCVGKPQSEKIKVEIG